MTSSIMLFLILLGASTNVIFCTPVNPLSLEKYLTGSHTKPGTCTDDGEIESTDPCKPFCVCHKGTIVCAEIQCTDDYQAPAKSFCGKVHVAGRCCHHYLCVAEDGTGTMFYPLPIVTAPDELYAESR